MINEKNIPTNPSLWKKFVDQAKKKFDVYPCVPLDSLAITKEGLKSYEEIEIGEDILTYNLNTDELEWKPVKNLHYYENADVMEIKKSTGFKFKCTPTHKWVIKRDETRKAELIDAKDITTHMRLVFSSVLNKKDSTFDILNEDWGKRDIWTTRIVNMSRSEREIWLSSAIVYDGWDKGKSTKIDGRQTFGFSQKNRDHLFSTIYAAILNGYYVHAGDLDADVVGVTIIRGKQTHGTQNIVKTLLNEKENVWCPETENGTWVMMQNGWFTITGNSAYANGWASKQYKDAGGKWKTESVEEPQHVATALPQTKELKGKKIGERFIEYLQDNGLKHAAYQTESGDVKIVGLNKDQVKEALGKLVNKWGGKKESVNEGKWDKIMKGVRGGSLSGPWTLVVVDKNKRKVVHQQDVKIKDAIPAHYEDIKRKFSGPSFAIAIEDNGGKIVYKESINEAPAKDNAEKIRNYGARISKLQKAISATKSPTQKTQLQSRLKTVLQNLSNLKRSMGIKRVEGLPGGAGVGVSLSGGYINGAPKSKDVKDFAKKNLSK
jgi:hypothetical protein